MIIVVLWNIDAGWPMMMRAFVWGWLWMYFLRLVWIRGLEPLKPTYRTINWYYLIFGMILIVSWSNIAVLQIRKLFGVLEKCYSKFENKDINMTIRFWDRVILRSLKLEQATENHFSSQKSAMSIWHVFTDEDRYLTLHITTAKIKLLRSLWECVLVIMPMLTHKSKIHCFWFLCFFLQSNDEFGAVLTLYQHQQIGLNSCNFSTVG